MIKVTKEELRDMILRGESIDDVDYSDITDMSDMFNGCTSLKKIPELDTSRVTHMYRMFEGCTSLEYIEDPLSFHLCDWKELNNPILKEKYPELYI